MVEVNCIGFTQCNAVKHVHVLNSPKSPERRSLTIHHKVEKKEVKCHLVVTDDENTHLQKTMYRIVQARLDGLQMKEQTNLWRPD